MKSKSRLLCFSMISAGLIFGRSVESAQVNSLVNVPGTSYRTIVVDGLSRTFIVYVGSSVGPTTPAPAVFVIHGSSQDGQVFYDNSRWREKADEVGLIVVFGDALTYCYHEDENEDGDFNDPGERTVGTKWAHGLLNTPAMPLCSAAEVAALSPAQRALANHPFQDDLLFVDAMIGFLRNNYVVDERRIYATGFSNGAAFSHRLAVERSYVFAAIAGHAGMLSVPVRPGRQVSFVTTLGSRDDRFTLPAGILEFPLSESLLTSYPGFKAKEIAPMLQQLKLADVYTYDEPLINGVKTIRYAYRTSTAGGSNSYSFSLIDNNFHAYPNGSNHPVVMANVLWPFFATQQLPNTELPFTVNNLGAVTRTTTGNSGTVTVGYGRIQAAFANPTPAGVAIFGYTLNGVLVSEAAVTASPPLQSATTYVEIGGAVNTGLAIANPNAQPATVNFYFTDAAGINFGAGSSTIPANGQIAKFLDESPFSPSQTAQRNLSDARAFTLTSSLPVGVTAIRGLTNERGEFLITTLPVTTANAVVATPVIFPHYADGGGWTTQVVLINPTNTLMTGSAQFFSQGTATSAGTPVTITVNGTAGSSFSYSVPPHSSFKMVTTGAGAGIRSGSVRVVPSVGSQAPVGVGIFAFRNAAGITVSESGVPALAPSSAFRLYAEMAGNFNGGESGSVQTGIAIANAAASPTTVTLALTNLDGSATGLAGTATVPANGQVALFLSQVNGLQTVPASFRGVLRISGAGISVVGLRGRYNQRGDFLIATTSPVDESLPATTAETVFAHIVDGGGYRTQVILFSGTPGPATTGKVLFFNQTAQPLAIAFGLEDKYTISGAISGPVVQGVTLTLATGATTRTAANGSYSFSGIANGNYTVTPFLAGYTFNPNGTLVTVNGADVGGTNFTSSATGNDANIAQALQCGLTPPGGPGNTAEFQQFILDPAVFPDALCNDGTPAVLYFRPYNGIANRNKWMLNLHGGGACGSGSTCAARWCSCSNTTVCPYTTEPTNFSRLTMTNASPRMKNADGVFLRDTNLNPYDGYNQVEFSYCTSDWWTGTRRAVQMTATNPKTNAPVTFTIHFLGAKVLDADIAVLRQAGVPALSYTLDGGSTPMPDLDEATEVIITGDSAGGNGVITNLDYLTASLRSTNVNCQGSSCPLKTYGLLDAIIGPDRSKLNYDTHIQPSVRSYADFLTLMTSLPAVLNARRDSSCTAFHAADNRPCYDESHVVRHHITTPFFVRMALYDVLISDNYISSLFQDPGPPPTPMTIKSFGQTLHRELTTFENLSATAEEGILIAKQPGVFAPGCFVHDTIHNTIQTYQTTITPAGGSPLRLLQLFKNWQNGSTPSNILTQSATLADTVCPQGP